MLKEIWYVLCRLALCATTVLVWWFASPHYHAPSAHLRTKPTFKWWVIRTSNLCAIIHNVANALPKTFAAAYSNIDRQSFLRHHGPGARLGRRRRDAIHFVVVMFRVMVKQIKLPDTRLIGQPDGLLPA